MKAKRLFAPLSLLLAAALACNMPAGGATATPTPAAAATETPIPAPAETATPAATASPTIPLISVSTATNCRSGPQIDFDLIVTINPGITAEVIGKNTGLNYWVIKIPGGSGQCWLWGQYATGQGNVAVLPEYPSPPTPTPAPTLALPSPTPSPTSLAFPAAPGSVTFTATCLSIPFSPDIFAGAYIYWTDNNTSEDGYRVYYGSSLLATLGPNSTSHYVTAPGHYTVDAFNSAGSQAAPSINVDCP